MKIGIDATPLNDQLTGVGNYLFYLLKELILQRPFDQFYLYAIRDSKTLEPFKKHPNVSMRINSCLGISEALWSQTTLSWMCYRDRLDLFWGVTQSIPLVARKQQRHIITIHDFAYRLYPHTTSTVRGIYLKWLGKSFYKRAHARLTNSQGTAVWLKKLYSLQTHAIVTPPLKVIEKGEVGDLFERYGIASKNYFLMVGTIEPRKNVVPALQAYCELIDSTHLFPLVIAGKPGWKDSHIKQEIAHFTHRYPKQIKMVGYLPDGPLSQLMGHARAYIMPSLYEGYGMPIAEARSLGTPIICCAIPEMIEAAEGDGLFVSLENFKQQLQYALLNPPTSLSKSCSYPSTAQLAARISQVITSSTL